MNYRKLTEGYVIQTFNDAGECFEQHFITSGDVTYETTEGDPINSGDMPLAGREYENPAMIQPRTDILKP